ncbi:MAG TPA: hypothetical protein DD727_02025, partial [Clostridiales bacterium]|nr:hypothetical protein [Clostridiales bacterium]
EIRSGIRRSVHADVVDINWIRTSYLNSRYKHILLPVWFSAYTYGKKTYHFVVNGQTGAVNGKRPVSWIKVSLVVIAGLVIAGLLYNYFRTFAM